MTSDDAKEFGRRIALLRKRLGYSQAEFARKVDRSETWLSQIERGVRRIDRMSVLDRLADALDVTVAELAPTEPAVAARMEKSTAASDLALTLLSNHALKALLSSSRPVDPSRIEARAAEAWEYTHAARYDDLAELLGELLEEADVLERHVAEEERPRVRRARARIYLAAAGALTKLSESGAAWVAIDRASAAAEQLGDPLLLAECAFRLAITFQAARRYDLAIRVAGTAAEAMTTLTDNEDADPAAVSLYGALRLQLAVATARTGDAHSAYSHLAHAHAAADRIGDGRNDYNTEFGPTNVDLHEVAVAVELGDAGRALRIAERVDAGHLSAERQGRLLIDLANANAQLRRTDDVIAALSQGLAVSPEQVAAHSRVRDLVADLAREHGTDPRVRELTRKITIR